MDARSPSIKGKRREVEHHIPKRDAESSDLTSCGATFLYHGLTSLVRSWLMRTHDDSIPFAAAIAFLDFYAPQLRVIHFDNRTEAMVEA